MGTEPRGVVEQLAQELIARLASLPDCKKSVRVTGKQDTDWYFADPTRDQVEQEGDDLFGEQ